MRTVHKFQIPVNGETCQVELPDERKLLNVDFIVPARAIFVWFEVVADMMAMKKPVSFRVYMTGDGIPDNASYLGTAIDQYQAEAYHLYEFLPF